MAISRKRVLIVDDDADLLKVLQLWLAKAELDVILASDGQKAFQILRGSEPFDLILTDFMMPELNGMELVRLVKGNARMFDTPIVVMSNNTDPEFRKQAIELGASAYVMKTIGARAIADRVIPMIVAREPGIPAFQPPSASAAHIQAMRHSLLALLRVTAQLEGLPPPAREALMSAEKLVEALFAAVPEPAVIPEL